jgi:hypothetical protein
VYYFFSFLEESAEKLDHLFTGFVPVPSRLVGMAYRKSIEGGQTGRIYEV